MQAHAATRDELANALTHGVGAVLAIAGLAVLVVLAALRGNAWTIVSCAVYGVSLALVYVISTLYHSFRGPRVKRVFRVLDHSSIFVLIAGTYTPFTLVTLRGAWGWALFAAVWSLTICGIVFKSLWVERVPVISAAVYVLMGWLAVIAIRPLWHAVHLGGMGLLLAGGVFYTLGLLFFGWSGLRYNHAIWHVFVILGSACHYLAVIRYVLPSRA